MIRKVAIDTGPLKSGHAVRGIGFHTKELLSAIDRVKHEFNSLEIYPVDFSKSDLTRYDLTHYTSFNPYILSLPWKKPTKKAILTIHDLIYLVFPKNYPAGIKGNIKLFIQKLLLKNIDGIITISNTSKADIVRFLGVSPEKIHTIYLAAKEKFKRTSDIKILNQVKTKYRLPNKFVLYVGDINYNKNIPTLITACRTAKVPLVLVGKQALDVEEGGMSLKDIHGPKDWLRFVFGKPHPELVHYKFLLEEIKKSGDVLRLGFVPDDDLSAIFSLATVYCQPSYYEGFGLTLLEAMACGTPVVASKIRAHTEIAGEAALFADPDDPSDFAQKIASVFYNPELRKGLIKKGAAQVKKYSWEKSARETLQVYEKVLAT